MATHGDPSVTDVPGCRRIDLTRAASVSSLRTLGEIAARTGILPIVPRSERRGRYRFDGLIASSWHRRPRARRRAAEFARADGALRLLFAELSAFFAC